MNPQLQIILQLILAVILGALIGLEREYKRKEAGLQTYSLVTLGACLFTVIGFELMNTLAAQSGINFDPGRVIQAIAIGIGFIGAGVVLQRKLFIEGLTTAAGLWLAAAIGVGVGAKFYLLAIFTTFLAILILAGLGELERKIFTRKSSVVKKSS